MGKMEDFHEDLNVALTQVHQVLEHWGLGTWKEYLIVRRPGKDQSFAVLCHPSDKSEFADKLVDLHRHESGEGR